jgi:carotenoid cleavage dioxygenase
MGQHLEVVDPAANAHLSGRFAPVHREVDDDDLAVEGTLPADLTGTYVRNGPNPRFTPLGSYTYPMEGDGMLHGVWLESGRARDTVGRHDFVGRLPGGMCAHPRIDPTTGEMVVFRYDIEEPFLTWATIGPDGTVARPPTTVEGVDECFMIHDFTITERFVVLVVAPAIIDFAAMGTDRDPLRWDAERPTRIAVIHRSGVARTRWIETDPFFVWHYGNAYEQGDEIVVDFPWWSAFTLPAAGSFPARGGFAHARLQPDRGTARIDLLDGIASEFPRIDDRRTARPHRYVTTSRKSGRHELATGEFDQLVRHDMRTGTTDSYDSDVIFGEVVFAPRDGATDDLDGYYLTYATSPDAKRSWLLVWDAATFPSDPIARIRTPQRVPHGLHGNWFPSS